MAAPGAGEDRQFRFAQFEFPWALGPDPGRYLVRAGGDETPTHVLVLSVLGAPQRRLLGRRRAHEAQPEPDPAPVATTRATVIESDAVDQAEAARWLAALDSDAREAALGEALRVLNRALAGHRLAAADPNVREVGLDGALVARLGHGRGEQVADGRWTEAIEVPVGPHTRRRRRVSALRPQERLAALLGGRDHPLACEELTLRARLDLDAGRPREAALQLRVALEAAIAELDRSPGRAADMAERVGELRSQRAVVGEAANAALAGDLEPESIEAVERALARVEAALRARSAGGFS
jgi:hypothetical protein